MFVQIGPDTFVRADHVVAITDWSPACEARQVTPLAWRALQPDALVVLRTGTIVPAYFRPQTIKRRVERALAGEAGDSGTDE